MMKDLIKDSNSLFNFLNDCSDKYKDSVFRGVKSIKYELIPTVGRLKTAKTKINIKISEERKLLSLFRQKGYPYFDDKSVNDLKLLAIAQHHGLPTRLLDWTRNPLVALYFATEAPWLKTEEDCNVDCDAQIFIWMKSMKGILEPDFDPFDFTDSRKDIKLFLPPYLSPRIIAQGGIFTIHKNPHVPYTSGEIKSILIDKSYRRELKRNLNQLGINRAALFPGLDGVAEYVKWLRVDMH